MLKVLLQYQYRDDIYMGLLEKTVYSQIVNYLESTNRNQIHRHQHGFRLGKSINTAKADLLETILDSWEKIVNVSGVFLDFRKAFDCLDLRVLLQELWKVGIRGNAYTCMESYLTDRAQFVEIRTAKGKEKTTIRSALRNMTSGVSQGSILVQTCSLSKYIPCSLSTTKLPPTTKCIICSLTIDDTNTAGISQD